MLKNLLKMFMAFMCVFSLNLFGEFPGHEEWNRALNEAVHTSSKKIHSVVDIIRNITSIKKPISQKNVEAYRVELSDGSKVICFRVDEGRLFETIYCIREFANGTSEICSRELFYAIERYHQKYGNDTAWDANAHYNN